MQHSAPAPAEASARADGGGPPAALLRLSIRQAGTLSRAQILAHGCTDEWIGHRLASQRWQRVHRGVYATFTGRLTWPARCWAATLFYGNGAALAGPTAIALALRQEPVDRRTIVVAVDHDRRVTEPEGIELWRVSGLTTHVQPAREPARMRLESAVLLTASRARTPDDAIATIADACQSWRTTAERLCTTLSELPSNLRFRRVLSEILADVATGAYSYLEVQYLRRVEKPHGLPTGSRQRVVRQGRYVWLRDVEYVGLDVITELDGRLGHETYDDRCNDLDRDNHASRNGKHTARAGYRQVIATPCATAQVVGDLLRAGVWRGQLRRCGPECTIT